MKSKLIIIALLFLFQKIPVLLAEKPYPSVKTISYEETVLYDFLVNYEEYVIKTIPNLYFELNLDNIDEDGNETLYLYLNEGHALCKESGSNIQEFCDFLNIMNSKSLSMLERKFFKNENLTQLVYFLLSVHYAKEGQWKKSKDLVQKVKEQSILNFYKDFLRILNMEEPNSFNTYYLNCLYRYYTEGTICPMDYNEDTYGYLTFFQAIKYFDEKEYHKAGELFLKAKHNKLYKIALENAVYSFFHAKEYDEAIKHAKKISDKLEKKIEFLINFEKGIKFVFYEDFIEEEISNFLTKNIKKHILDGKKLDFMMSFKIQSDNEELNFWLCLVDVINKRTNFNKNCIKRSWSDKYANLMNLIKNWYIGEFSYENIANKEALEAFIEDSGLKKYYPFNFFLAELAFENKKYNKAQYIYEYFIRYPLNISNKELENVYYKIALIYENKKSYYTALKFLEKNLEKAFNSIKNKSRVEYIKVLYLKGDCEKAIFYANYFLENMKELPFKQEIEAIIELCKERELNEEKEATK